jgi:hypothetical protein
MTLAFQAVMGSKYNDHVVVHRDVLIRDYSQLRLHEDEFQSSIRTTSEFKASLRIAPLLPIVSDTVGHYQPTS